MSVEYAMWWTENYAPCINYEELSYITGCIENVDESFECFSEDETEMCYKHKFTCLCAAFSIFVSLCISCVLSVSCLSFVGNYTFPKHCILHSLSVTILQQ